jgi:hypothetical protein
MTHASSDAVRFKRRAPARLAVCGTFGTSHIDGPVQFDVSRSILIFLLFCFYFQPALLHEYTLIVGLLSYIDIFAKLFSGVFRIF